jgi:dienelactone hydrolase
MQFRAACRQRDIKATSGGLSGYHIHISRFGRQIAARGWVVSPPRVIHINNVKGKGTFTTCDVQAGQIICQYLGQVIGFDEMNQRDDHYTRADLPYKFIDLGKGRFIDGYRDTHGNMLSVEQNPAATMNHSLSSPNCRLVKEGDIYVIKALTGISKGGECTWDYGDRSNGLAHWYYQ